MPFDISAEFIPDLLRGTQAGTLPDRRRVTRLGQVLDEVSAKGSRVSAGAVATIRLLMLRKVGVLRSLASALSNAVCVSERRTIELVRLMATVA